MPSGQSEQAIPGHSAQPALGVGLYLRVDLEGLCLRCLCHRHFCEQDCRVEGLDISGNSVRAALSAACCACACRVIDALEQALHARSPAENLIHHSDRGSQYVSIKYTERLVDAGLEPSVGSVGDSYDNALAETMIGLFKTEVINRLGPWKSKDQVEWETLKWVDWFNTKRLLEPLGYITPQEAEDAYYQHLKTDDIAA